MIENVTSKVDIFTVNKGLFYTFEVNYFTVKLYT